MSPVRSVGVLSCALGATLLVAAACHTTPDPRPGLAYKPPVNEPLLPPADAGVADAAGLPRGPLSCGDAPTSQAAFSKNAMLAAVAECAAWHTCMFENSAHVLKSSIDAASSDASDGKRATAQLAYRLAMDAWSKMELFQFGPMARQASDKYYGRGIRTYVHPWPDTSRCQVETQVALKGYQKGFDLVFPSGRGLFAVEYLLHYPGQDSACSPSSTAGTAWSGLSGDAIVQAKRDYAKAVAADVLGHAQSLSRVWSPSGENFKAKLLSYEGYGSEQETLNVVAWSMLYVEKEVKDLKLGSLAGVQTSPPNLETPYAQIDIENIRSNLRAFQSLYQGCGPSGAGLGFDDWLKAAGHAELAAEVDAQLQIAIAAADAFPAFYNATESEFADFYGKVRQLTTLLKTRVFGSASPLNLKLPASAASDTD